MHLRHAIPGEAMRDLMIRLFPALAIAILGAYLAGCERETSDTSPTARGVAVEVQPAEIGLVRESIVGWGRVEQLQTAEVASPTEGRVLELAVLPGDRVRKGQMLARIRRAEAEIVRGSGFAEVEIRAPFAGTVLERLVRNGQVVAVGQVLVRLQPDASPLLFLRIPASSAHRVRPGLPVTVRFPALGEVSFAGSVETLLPAADPSTQKVSVRVKLPSDPRIVPGLFAEGEIHLAERQALRVPDMAVLAKDDTTVVFLARRGRAEIRPVHVGIRYGPWREICAGLTEGDSVIVVGNLHLENGTPIEVRGGAR